MVKYCDNCGRLNPSDSRFCAYCNKKIEEVEEKVIDKKQIKNLDLFVRIPAVVIGIMFIDSLIRTFLICSNCGLDFSIDLIFYGLPFLATCFVIFILIQRTHLAKFINSKNVNIFCVILGIILAAIVMPQSINNYYDTVPPKEVTNYWLVNEGQDIQNHMAGMEIIYDTTYATKTGCFTVETNNMYQSNVMEGTNFVWSYDESTKAITLTEQDTMWSKKTDGWTLTLRLDINKSEEPHYTMTTYYVSNTNFTFFNTTLLDGATWTGASDYNDQGR